MDRKTSTTKRARSHDTDVPTWDSLLDDVAHARAHILLEQPWMQPRKPGTDRLPHERGHVIVQRIDGVVWEAFRYDLRSYREARAWTAADVEKTFKRTATDYGYPPRLDVRDAPRLTTAADPNWTSLLLEVGANTARLLVSETLRDQLQRVVVQRGDGSVWEALRSERRAPALRWTDWEADALLKVDEFQARRVERLQSEICGALSRARTTEPERPQLAVAQ